MSPRKSRPAKTSYSTTLWDVSPAPADYRSQAQSSTKHQFTSHFLHSVWPLCFKPPTSLATMGVEETAIWVHMLAGFKGWKECEMYSLVFKANDISGYMLSYLSVQALKDELEIFKFGHRLEIVAAIKSNELTLLNPTIVSLCPDIFFMLAETPQPHLGSEAYNSLRKKQPFRKKQHKGKEHELEVHKWFSNGQVSQSLSSRNMPAVFTKGTTSALIGRSSRNWVNDSLTSGMKKDGIKSEKGILPATTSELQFSWIPPIELPPTEAESAEKVNKVEFGRWFEEHPSSMFSGSKTETTAISSAKSPLVISDDQERKN